MALTPRTRIGPYEVIAQVGAGGMGEVYSATDTNLKRAVALKVLPTAVASDPDRLARFQREAEVLAALNHPNIAAIYGLERADGTTALVMELVEGPTLADRIAQGAVPIDEALPIAKQIAEALEAAHEQGIIHRDLKPANIKVRPDGAVKVLDFGLAKAMEPVGVAPASVSQMPTITTPAMTQIGTILGTAAYMSPEQARGQAADRRSDIWAFGCVLYETLTGQRAFEGATVSDTLAAVLRSEPDLAALPADTPAPLRILLRRCLEKDRRRRLESAADARLEVEEAQRGATSLLDYHAPAVARPSAPGAWLVAAGLGTVAAALAVTLAVTLRPGPAPPEIRLEIATPPTSAPFSIAVSPDGQWVVFAAMGEGGSQLFLRALASGVGRPLAGTVGATSPFWSPDSRSIAFFAADTLTRLDIDSGSTATLAPVVAGQGQGGSWSADGTILFVPGLAQSVYRVAASGGEATAVGTLEGQASQRFPRFLPDGRHYLFYASGGDDVRGVYVGGVDGFQPKRILDGETSAPVFSSLGHLFFVRQGRLFAQPFNLDRLELTGRPAPLAEGVTDAGYRTGLSVSETGTVIYRTGAVSQGKQLVWFSRAGERLGVAGETAPAHTSPSLSPDGRRVVWHQGTGGNVDLWLFDLERAFASRFTRDESSQIMAVWSPDGSQIAFSSFRNGVYDLYRQATGGGEPELLLATPESKLALDWSLDGRFVLYRIGQTNLSDLWAVRVQGGQKPFAVVATSGNEQGGQFSPDSQWLAYESDESGRREVYLQPFPGPGTRIQVSTAGGAQVRWRRDGREVFYVGLDERLMTVPVRLSGDGRSADIGAPAALFPTRMGGAVPTNSGPFYMVSQDAQRFLMDTVVDEGPTSPISVILNWRGNPQP